VFPSGERQQAPLLAVATVPLSLLPSRTGVDQLRPTRAGRFPASVAALATAQEVSMKVAQVSRVVSLVALALVTAVAHVGFAQVVTDGKSDPGIGTWKLNVAKSTYNPGPPPKSTTITIEPRGNGGEKVTVEGIAADGSRVAWSCNVDGKDNAFIAGSVGIPSGADTLAVKAIDTYTFEAIYKKAGKVVNTNGIVYSKDGKMRTSTGKSTDAAGKPTSNVTIWDRQ
jgi:hypothetical protein